jgi:DNA end-binding protein Ku
MLSGPFDPAQYRDDYREAVLAMIERKVAGEEIAVAPEAPAPAAVPDLMAALQASVAAVGKYDAKWAGAAAGAKPKPKRRAKAPTPQPTKKS